MSKNFKIVIQWTLALLMGCVGLLKAESRPGNEDMNLLISPSEKGAKIMVKAWNLSADAPATLKILDKFGSTVYEEAVESEEQHTKLYDFSKMEAGKYTLILEGKTGEIKKPFIVGLNGIVREDKSEMYQSFRPLIIEKRKECSVYIAFKNVGNVPLKLTVTNSNGNVVYSENVSGYQEYNKVVNLKKLSRGQYSVNVYNADYSYHRDVKNY